RRRRASTRGVDPAPPRARLAAPVGLPLQPFHLELLGPPKPARALSCLWPRSARALETRTGLSSPCTSARRRESRPPAQPTRSAPRPSYSPRTPATHTRL